MGIDRFPKNSSKELDPTPLESGGRTLAGVRPPAPVPSGVLPKAFRADLADGRELGPDVTAVYAGESARAIDAAYLFDRIDQAWSVPCADDDFSCLAC